MASTDESERFASLSSKDLLSLLENRDSSNTKQCVDAARICISAYGLGQVRPTQAPGLKSLFNDIDYQGS